MKGGDSMTTVRYTATVKANRLLELPEEAVHLHLQPGQAISILLEQEPEPTALAAFSELLASQKDRPYADASDTMMLLHEARDGAMYGYDPS
jgi:hypothetical protein